MLHFTNGLKKFRHSSILIIGFTLFVPNSIIGNEIITPIDGLFATGEQIESLYDILSQSVMIGSGIQFQSPKKKIETYMKSHEIVLTGLKTNFSSHTVQENISMSEDMLVKLKPVIQNIITEKAKAKIRQDILNVDKDFLKSIEALVNIKKHFLKEVPEKRRSFVDVGFTLGSLIEQLSTFYLMKIWNTNDNKITDKWNKIIKEYKISLDILKNSPYAKDPKFSKMIRDSDKTLFYFESLWSLSSAMPSLVVKKTQRELKRIQKIKQYIVDRI